MFALRKLNGKYAPVILCDICEQRITDAQLAAVVSYPDSDEHALQPVLQVHKGECLDAAEAKVGVPDWDELSDHLIMLVHNVGATLENLVEQRDLNNEAGL